MIELEQDSGNGKDNEFSLFSLALMTISTKLQGKIHFPLANSRPAFLTQIKNSETNNSAIGFSLLIFFFIPSPHILLSFSYIQKEELL